MLDGPVDLVLAQAATTDQYVEETLRRARCTDTTAVHSYNTGIISKFIKYRYYALVLFGVHIAAGKSPLG